MELTNRHDTIVMLLCEAVFRPEQSKEAVNWVGPSRETHINFATRISYRPVSFIVYLRYIRLLINYEYYFRTLSGSIVSTALLKIQRVERLKFSIIGIKWWKKNVCIRLPFFTILIVPSAFHSNEIFPTERFYIFLPRPSQFRFVRQRFRLP